MSRRASLLVGLVSIAILVVALVVYADRQDDDGLLVSPTAVPSPTAPVGQTPPPFSLPPDTPALSESPVGPAQTGSPLPATPTPTPFIIPTPTPAPASTPIPDTSGSGFPDGPTPVTGGGAIAGGLAVLLLSGAARVFAGRLR